MEQQKTEAEIQQRIEQLKKITRKDGGKEYAQAQFNLASIYYLYKKDLKQAIDHLLNIEKQDNPEIYAQAQLNLGNTYQYIYNNFEQAERYYLNVEKHDNLEVYASAQLNLGFIYQEAKHNIEMAEHYYSKVEKKDNPREYSAAQVNLGVIYQNKQNFGQAEQCYLNAKKQDNPKAYAGAQLNLGIIYQEVKHNIEQAERCYLNVEKQGNPEAYAQAQLSLGFIYQNKQDIEQAEQYYSNVRKQDNPEVYANAQVNLGIIYQYEYNNFEQAERCYLNVKKHDDPKSYAQAQMNLGVVCQNKQDIEQAKRYYLNVKKQDNPEEYAAAQVNLGVIYKNKQDIEQAERCFLNVNKQDNSEVYACAQFNLGIIYQNEKHDFKQAERYFFNVNKQDNPEKYAAAQVNLGVIYKNKQDIEQAERCYLNVNKQDNSEVYAYAQFNLGVIYQYEYNNSEQAERYFLNVNKQDNSEVYAYAQFNLGIIYQNEKHDFKLAERCFLNIENQYYPELCTIAKINLNYVYRCLGDDIFFNKEKTNSKLAIEYYQRVIYSQVFFRDYIIAQVMLSVINDNILIFEKDTNRDDYIINPICDIRDKTIEIQKGLLVKFNLNESKNNDGLVFERQVAHYTKPEVLFNLLKNKPSDFRLNVVDFMNDPTENQVLTDWLGINTENNNEIKTFLASFSFNHNSLNQFRLYGNENNIVGSSISLVFNKKFFGDDIKRSINPASINYFFNNADFGLAINDSAKSGVATMGLNNSNENLNQKSDNTRNDLNENSDPKNSETVAEKNITSSVGSLPLFRCLYFDPKSGYISIAKRNKYSFYLEHQSDSPENIDAKWNNYLHLLNEEEKINTVREKLQQIEEIIHSLKNPEEPKQKEIIEKITNLDQLIALALMPISCLVKHAAFEDEDECRMIYITNIADDLIQAPEDYAYANSLFVNYGKIEDYLEKIYLGPQCQPHHKLWITNHVRTSQSKTRSKPIKVVQSEMPLR